MQLAALILIVIAVAGILPYLLILHKRGNELDKQVREQSRYLQQKTKALEILYEVAAYSNTTRDIEQLLVRYLHTLSNILQAKAATVRIYTHDNQLRVLDQIGIDTEFPAEEFQVPIERCLCAQNFPESVIFCDVDSKYCPNHLIQALPANDNLRLLVVPLHYQNETLGTFHLFMESENLDTSPETTSLVANIAQHLSLALEKVRIDNESRRYTLMQERAMLAHEIHDSLAQTLASLRFQIRSVSKTIQNTENLSIQEDIEQLKSGLDEANNEVRELLAHFRVHMDERGLIPATEALIERFKSESGLSVYFQNECKDARMPPLQEVQVLHIIQESLTNIRKHSQASHVRVLLRQLETNHYYILVEDDGVGITQKTLDGQPGEHVGLSIMQERARRINAELSIDSEEGEGTRIELEFTCEDSPDTFKYTQLTPPTTTNQVKSTLA